MMTRIDVVARCALRVRQMVVAILMGCAAGASAVAAQAPDTWLLTAARVYVSPDERAIDDGALLVRQGKIAAVGKRRELSVPAGTQTSECSGGFVTAGFHNSHVHFIGDQWTRADKKSASALSRSMTEMLTRFGYTSVADIASDRDNTLALRARVDSGEVPGPRILTVGLPLFPPHGIPLYLKSFSRELLQRLPQPETTAAAVKIVRANIDAGADGTKLFIATPQGAGKIARMPADIARAAADETHRRGKLVLVHPTDLDGLRAALALNVDILAHSTLGAESLWPGSLLNQVIESKVALIPTLKLLEYELRKENVPQDVTSRLVSISVDQVKAFSAAGGEILFGTDVGYMSDFDPTEEYLLLSRAGLTPMQILAALTTSPAARWKADGQRGRLSLGMDADITVLNVDPAADAAGFAKVRCTVRDGKIIYSSVKN
jgi:imidazolonepropionase-like amidohydrolase